MDLIGHDINFSATESLTDRFEDWVGLVRFSTKDDGRKPWKKTGRGFTSMTK
jgi:hypothetical protein